MFRNYDAHKVKFRLTKRTQTDGAFDGFELRSHVRPLFQHRSVILRYLRLRSYPRIGTPAHTHSKDKSTNAMQLCVYVLHVITHSSDPLVDPRYLPPSPHIRALGQIVVTRRGRAENPSPRKKVLATCARRLASAWRGNSTVGPSASAALREPSASHSWTC